MQGKDATSPNTAYTLRAYAFALRSQRRICWGRYLKF